MGLSIGVILLFLLLNTSLEQSWWEKLFRFLAPEPMSSVSGFRTALRSLPLLQPCNKNICPADLQRLDMLFAAVHENSSSLQECCFILTLGTMTHKAIPLNIGINVPLTLETDSIYRQRVSVLPKYIFYDTPPSGDADKIQHFFASAWLVLSTDNAPLSAWLGELVEQGETVFVEGEPYDQRDIRANALGISFALDRMQGICKPPSWYFQSVR